MSRALDVDQDRTIEQLETAVPVRLIATFEKLRTTTSNALVSQASAAAEQGGFDYLPVRDEAGARIIGIFTRAGENPTGSPEPEQTVGQSAAYEPVGPDDLISSETSLLHFVWTAHQQPRRLVLDGTSINGIVTLSDLQKLPVRIALFSLFIHFELLLTAKLRSLLGSEDPFKLLPPSRAKKSSEKWMTFVLAGMDQDKLSSLDLCDKRMLAESMRLLDRQPAQIERSFKAIENQMRNPIAHGASYAETRTSALQTIHAALDTKRWIEDLKSSMQLT